MIYPGDFIPLFEQNGFIYELDKYVWREACRYLRKWTDEGQTPLPVSVNVSRYDIFRADLVEVITGLAKEYAIPHELLRLEVTESAFATSTDQIVGIVGQLIGLGFTIEIDDFGSGYSSLNTLKSVPAQIVKLDMRFLEDGNHAQRGGSILESIVRMAKWLGMTVIAEGVETREQGDFLKSIGCSYVQGYLYAKPMPAADYEALSHETPAEAHPEALETIENLDNASFWDPGSLDTLMFNSYVGAACVLEYRNGRMELVRATDKYARMLGGDTMTVEQVLQLDFLAHLDPTSGAELLSKVDAYARSKGEVTAEYMFLDLPGCGHELYLRSTMRVIAVAGDRYLIYCISENITQQRLAERQERRVTRQLQAILDNINAGITAVTLDGQESTYLLTNSKYYELLGYTREQYDAEIGKRAFQTVHPDDRQRVQNASEHTRATGEPGAIEYRVVRRDGSVAWLRSFLSMSTFEGLESGVQLCTYSDITHERHVAQDLLNNLPCGAGMCAVTEDGAYMTYVNKRYLTYFKNNDGTRSRQSLFDVVHPDDRETLSRIMRPALDTGGEGTCVVRIQDEPGEYIPFRVSGVALQSTDKTNVIYVTFVPISHEELSVGEMLTVALDKMMSSSPALAFVKDKNLRYVCCSHTFAQMVGLESEKDVAGKTDYDLFSKELADKYIADDRKLIADGESMVNMVEHLPSDDGKIHYASTSKYLLNDSHGNVVGLYGVGQDITESREAETRQKFLLNSIPGGVAVYEGQWGSLSSIHLTYFSDGFCHLFGYTREEYEQLGKKNPTGLVAEEHLPGLVLQIEKLVTDNTPIDYVYRAHTKNGGYCWIHLKAVGQERRDAYMIVNAVLFDVTEHQSMLEQLRISEEENRLAISHSKNVVCRYDAETKSLKVSPGANGLFGMPSFIENVPYSQIQAGLISPETANEYASFYERILHGEQAGHAVYQRKSSAGWRWIEAHFSTIFSQAAVPVSAVISFVDVTENYERDVVYRKWLQALRNKETASYSLYRCNISRRTVAEISEGALLNVKFTPGNPDMDLHTAEYAAQYVMEEDVNSFHAFLDPDTLLYRYKHGELLVKLEYREKVRAGVYRWLSLTVDMVEYPHSTDVEAYLLFEDIDETKRAELLTLERAETDPLTGLLNRNAFAEKVGEMIRASSPIEKHAMIMLDIDGFKLVNDTFGHAAGDQVLVDIANLLRTLTRREDLICRMGGDEFAIFLRNIPGERVASAKAQHICDLTRKAFSAEVQISASVGIALYPRDGSAFDTLYRKADETLYHVKETGRDNYAFYEVSLKDGRPEPDATARKAIAQTDAKKKKERMLIVDDSKLDYEFLANVFRNDFVVERAKNGNAALVRLRYYGSAVSVVLLDLMMPGMDGFAVLEELQRSPETRAIPVVVVSGSDDPETSLRAIREGASDFVTKPVDVDVLRIRVYSAISKADNERLRAKNSFLELQNAEANRNKAVLDWLHLAVVEMDWRKGTFDYSPAIAQYIAGAYDGRTLWQIFLTDFVADTQTVKDIQRLLREVADDRECTKGTLELTLKTPEGKRHRFRLDVYKLLNEYGIASKMILTFKDMETARLQKPPKTLEQETTRSTEAKRKAQKEEEPK